MKNKKRILLFIILIIVGISLIIGGIFLSKTKKELNKEDDINNGNNTNTELVPLTTNTNDLLIFIEDGVNEELIGTYAFIEVYSFSSYDTSKRISAVKQDGSVVEILSVDIEDIETYLYYEGKLYIETKDETFYIDLTQGNGNYSLEKLEESMEEDFYSYELIDSLDKEFEKEDNSCIKINGDDFVCQIYYDNDSEYIMHYLSATIGGKESWKLQDENKSFYLVGILSNNKLLIEIHENGNVISDNDMAIVDLATGKILENEKLDIENKGGLTLYYVN